MKHNTEQLFKLQISLTIFFHSIKNIHWNFKGVNFFEYHEELDKTAEKILCFIDELAEKQLMQKSKSEFRISKFNDYKDISLIKENDDKYDLATSTNYIVSCSVALLKFIETITWSFTEQPLIDEIVLYLDSIQWKYSAHLKD